MKLFRLKVLIGKDFKLILANKNILLLFSLPLIFALIYSQIPLHDGAEFVYQLLAMITLLGLGAIGASIMPMAIAEEKEKKTMRSLTLAGVHPSEFIISKMLVVLFFFVITMTLSFAVIRAPWSYYPMYLLLLVLSTISLFIGSSSFGLLAETQQATGILATPLMFLVMSPLLTMFIDNEIVKLIVDYSPAGPLFKMILFEGGFVESYNKVLGVTILIAWIIVAILIFNMIYRRKSIDN